MAIIKYCNSKSKRGLKSLKCALNYVDNPNKVHSQFVGGIALNGKTAYERMATVKRLWHKCDGRQYTHIVFSPGGIVSDDIICNITKEMCSYFEEFTSFFGVHHNTDNTHSHVIINSVSTITGKKFHQSKHDLQKLKDFVNGLCIKYGLTELCQSQEHDFINLFENDECFFEGDENFSDDEIYGMNELYYYDPQIDISYVPNISDGYMPACYRLAPDGRYYPISPINKNGMMNMITTINPDTDIIPMILHVDDDGNYTL